MDCECAKDQNVKNAEFACSGLHVVVSHSLLGVKKPVTGTTAKWPWLIPGWRGSVRAGGCRGSPGGSPSQNRAKAFSSYARSIRVCFVRQSCGKSGLANSLLPRMRAVCSFAVDERLNRWSMRATSQRGSDDKRLRGVTRAGLMANALIYHVYSGQAFFSGAALVLLAWLAGLFEQRRWLAALRAICACTGLILIGVSATPLAEWFYLISGAITLMWIAVDVVTRTRHRRWKLYVRWAMAAVLGLGVALEVPFHLAPRLTALGNPPVFVIGDSLTAGVGGPIDTWPKLLAREHGMVISDLSVAGADATTALRQAKRISRPGSLVIVEIGGNDILRDYPPAVFERGLDTLLAKLRQGNHTIVMLELPLPPLCNRYGEAQRRLARRHGVLLIPKRMLLGVLTTEGATLDTIHLSADGHQRMAQTIWHIIHPVFARQRLSDYHTDRG